MSINFQLLHTLAATSSKCFNSQPNKARLHDGNWSISSLSLAPHNDTSLIAPASSNLESNSVVRIGSGNSLKL